MKIRLGETTYTPAALDRITLRNLMKLESETAALGRPMRWGDLRGIAQRVGALPEAEVAMDDDFPWYLGMLIWAARLEAGEEISFTDAVDFPMGDLEFIAEEGDGKPRPPKARPASGRAGARQPADRRPKKKVSVRQSSDA